MRERFVLLRTMSIIALVVIGAMVAVGVTTVIVHRAYYGKSVSTSPTTNRLAVAQSQPGPYFSIDAKVTNYIPYVVGRQVITRVEYLDHRQVVHEVFATMDSSEVIPGSTVKCSWFETPIKGERGQNIDGPYKFVICQAK